LDAVLDGSLHVVQVDVESLQTVRIQHNPSLNILTAGRAGRTGAGLGLPARASAAVGQPAALMTSLGQDLLLLSEEKQFGLSQTQNRVSD
jgi:hypothetical protein